MKGRANEPPAPAIRAVQRFLHRDTTGCHFVGASIAKGDVWAQFKGPVERAVIDDLNGVLDSADADGVIAVAVFPAIARLDELDTLIDEIAANSRWSRETELATSPAPARHERLYWASRRGHKVSLMGLAPALCMPPTRRAPFVSLVAWPGTPSNPYKKKPSPAVGLGDMPIRGKLQGISESKYKELRTGSSAEAGGINGLPLKPETTFVLPLPLKSAV